MTNAGFNFENATYTATESGYFYKTTDGKKTRIKKSEYEDAYNASVDQAIREKLAGVLNNAGEPAITEEYVEEATEAVSLAMETEAVLEAAQEAQGQEKAKSKPRKRIPKSVGYRKTHGETEVILTEKQVDFLKHLPDTCFWEEGTNSAVWIDCLCDEIGGQFAGKPMTVGAMVSTLCEKNLGYRIKTKVNNKKCTGFALTELGKQVAEDLGL